MLQDFDRQLIELSDVGKKAIELLQKDVKSYVTNMFIQLFSLLGKNPNLTRIALQHATESDQIRKKLLGK
jgi:hypothetical protein